jgi:hypothetical protein
MKRASQATIPQPQSVEVIPQVTGVRILTSLKIIMLREIRKAVDEEMEQLEQSPAGARPERVVQLVSMTAPGPAIFETETAKPVKTQRNMSAAARRRISLAQKRRWAAHNKQKAVVAKKAAEPKAAPKAKRNRVAKPAPGMPATQASRPSPQAPVSHSAPEAHAAPLAPPAPVQTRAAGSTISTQADTTAHEAAEDPFSDFDTK